MVDLTQLSAVMDLNQIAAILKIAVPILILIIVWTVIWKALALWKAARNNSKVWFIILLIVNTLGILEILYIFIFSKIGKQVKVKKVKRRR